MSHLALYRKYRPQSFAEVRGQENAIAYLESIIASGRIPHALLFTGTRGIGKTTLARIFGKTLEVDAHDIYEIDAASNNGVDGVRKLIDEVNTLPLSSQYKIYILDEIHMFSKPAFNALLKVLEEPPKHVIFVFATTELHKIIPTIISRCQVIQLKKPSDAIIAEQVISIAEREGYTVNLESALLIAHRASGSFRDALVVLDQVLEQSLGKDITIADIERIGIRMTNHLVIDFLKYFRDKDQDKIFSLIHQVESGDEKVLIDFIESCIHAMRIILYIKYAPTLWKQEREILSSDYIECYQICSDQEVITPKILGFFLKTYEEMQTSSLPKIPLELAIITIFGTMKSVP